MTEWQPIETAPKDGTDILLWLGEPFNQTRLAGFCRHWGTWVEEEPNDFLNEEIFGIGCNVPTHWMPLPEPPK